MNPQNHFQYGRENIVAADGGQISVRIFNGIGNVPNFESLQCPNCFDEDLQKLREDAGKWRTLPDPVKEILEDCGGFAQIIPLQ